MPQDLGSEVAIYDTWDCVRTRVSIPGVAMMPLAGIPPQQSIPVVLDGGTDYETVEFVAGRWGAPPVVPAPKSGNNNRIFLGGAQSAWLPIIGMGGIEYYRVSGCYVWGILNPEGLLGDFLLGSAPMPNQAINQPEMIPANNFQTNLINDGNDPQISKSNARGDELRRHLNSDY